jgi:hypothetical protein
MGAASGHLELSSEIISRSRPDNRFGHAGSVVDNSGGRMKISHTYIAETDVFFL